MVNLRSLQIMQDNSTVLWGELEDSDSEKVNLNPTDRELLLRIPKPLSLEGPRIHQPKITDLKSQNYSYNLQESYVTHGVQLLSYINDLNKIKEAAISRREKGILPILGKENPSHILYVFTLFEILIFCPKIQLWFHEKIVYFSW